MSILKTRMRPHDAESQHTPESFELRPALLPTIYCPSKNVDRCLTKVRTGRST
jgi:hypothetical protein